MLRPTTALAFVLSWSLATSAIAAAPEPSPPPTPHTARLARLCKVWGTIKFLHPWLWTHDLDWDAALLRALPAARAAVTDDEFAAAVGAMLAELHDPVTRVAPLHAPAAGSPASATGTPFLSWPKKGLLLIHLATPHKPADSEKVAGAMKDATQIILDLRFGADGAQAWSAFSEAKGILGSLITHELRTPPSRWVAHEGYKPQKGVTSGGYQSFFEEQSVSLIAAKPGALHRPLTVICNEVIGVPEEALALQTAGEAALVIHGTTLDDLLTAGEPLPLDAKHVVRLRQSELVPVGAPPRAEAELAADADDAKVLATAIAKLPQATAAAHTRAHANPKAPAALLPLLWRPDKTYAGEHTPSPELRLLALFRLWTIIEHFYPYKPLLDEPWDDVLTAFIPRFESAEGTQAYVETLAELSTHVADAHTGLRGGDMTLISPIARPRLLAQMIEGQPVIVAVGSDEETQKSGLRAGDVIVTIDGEPVAARLARTRRFVAGSNDAVRDLRTLARALNGADGSTLALTVRDAAGKSRPASVTRHVPAMGEVSWRSGEIIRILDGNIGYVDLDRLKPESVGAMFDKLKDTRAIIFDMRGYPNGTAWPIAPRLNVRNAKVAAQFERRFVRGNGESDAGDGRYKFVQTLPPKADGDAIYRGKTLMLVDERTISQAEHTGLFFEAAAGTKFVGSRTAGANGDVTVMTLPGDISMSFTGHDVRHADGRQLQRVGLPIDYPVKPTLKGLQSGRDEVLERALQILGTTR